MRGGLIVWTAVVLVLAGCSEKRSRDVSPSSIFPQRVVCASPAVAEIVFALDCGDRVVGVSEFTDWPPEAAAKPPMGGALAPNRERLLRLEPDLILAQGMAEALRSFARQQGMAYLSVPLDTLADLRAAIAAFAAALGVEENGRKLLSDLESNLAAIPACEPVPVFIALGHAPGDLSGLMTSGPGTFLDEIVTLASGSNIFADVQIRWPKISQETLVRRKPELILDFQPHPADEPRRAALVSDWERLGFSAGQVRLLREDYLLKPGPRAAQAAARVAAAICDPVPPE